MEHHHDSCHGQGNKRDYFFFGILALSCVFYLGHLAGYFGSQPGEPFQHLFHSFFELVNKMSWGILLGVIFVGIMGQIPRDYLFYFIGQPKKTSSIWRATLGGVLLDMCSHGILIVGAKLYRRGASLGQVMAFLIASPWNSLSLTIILISLIGLGWTLIFILLSAVVAVITGHLFDYLVRIKVLPENPYEVDHNNDFDIVASFKRDIKKVNWSGALLKKIFKEGLHDSKVIIKWVLFGALVASLVKVFVEQETFQAFFGPSLLGLWATLLATTVIEVCSEGSTPIAADILNRASAPGNAFTFLMAGVATDYTEILTLREVTKSWKIALFLPLLTVPQIMIIGYFLNQV